MDQRESFNAMMQGGISYENYKKIDSNHHERMQGHWDAIDKLMANLTQEQIDRLDIPLQVLVIAEAWCGDCANGVPIISRLVSKFSNWEFRIALRDKHEELVKQHYLTAGRKKIPVLVIANRDEEEIIRWVERPARSYQIIRDLKHQGLQKDEYLKKVRGMWELNSPSLSEEIFREVLDTFERATNLLAILS